MRHGLHLLTSLRATTTHHQRRNIMATNDVTFRPKSSWQKPDCINNSAEHQCHNESTLEAVLGNSLVRCCDDEVCKARAAEIARLTETAV
ncbi:MAG: hypothetical protein US63_C0048G0010 [Candidatus Moranbacteria bacterium GW2011_GWC2_37_8]|nr:MAG: hypothetical protein US63_C0048G0010 [Candidatus Moranbacteria bacterium GW2011_GWC2_37_8]KKQ60070.1 MAG: hypothetical protein US82_C0045G0006 [Parcubacteria group bacterium GW2011_GWC1_38_22]